jgi:phosphoheptose isomerase
MSVDSAALLRRVFQETVAAHDRFAATHLPVLVAAADAIVRCLSNGGKVIAFGNGGSAADAQHFVTELVGRFEVERRSLPGIALTADSNVLTAIANDYGFEAVFSRQIDGLGQAGDIAFGISTSGGSLNVLRALEAATAAGLITVALTGRDGGPIGQAARIHINVSEPSTPRVQEVHRTVLHAICALVDEGLGFAPR